MATSKRSLASVPALLLECSAVVREEHAVYCRPIATPALYVSCFLSGLIMWYYVYAVLRFYKSLFEEWH